MPRTNQENYTEQIKSLINMLYERKILSECTTKALLKKMHKFYLKDFTDEGDSYKYAENELSNFSNKVKGEKRVLNANDIIALERVSGMSFDDIVKLNYENKDFKPRGIRYAAWCDTYELFEELYNTESDEGLRLIECHDEYSKNIFDYVIEYKSYKGLGFLIEKGYLDYYNGLSLNIGYSNGIKEDSVLKMLLESENAHLFIQLLESCKEDFWLDERHYGAIIESEPVIKHLTKIRELDDFGCRGIIPVCYSLLKYAYKNGNMGAARFIAEEYRRFIDGEIKKLLPTINKKEHNEFYVLYERLSACIYLNGNHLFFAWDVDKYSEHARELGLKSISEIMNEISHKNPDELSVGERIYEKDFYYVRLEECLYTQMLEYLNEQGFTGVPKILDKQNGVYKIERTEGVPSFADVNIAPVARVLGRLHAISEKRLGTGRVYAFGPSLRGGLGMRKYESVITSESVKIGEPVSELVWLILSSTDIMKHPRDNEELLESISEAISYYKESYPINCFGDKMAEELDKRLLHASKKAVDYESEYECLYWAKSFVEIYKDELNEI